MSDFPTRHPYSLGIFQNQIERIMAAWIAELPVRIYYGCEVTGFAQDDTGVDVELSDGEPLRARYLVGCDGGRSLIRKAAGIEFPGWDPTRSNLIAEVELTEEPPPGVRHDAAGVHGLAQDGGREDRVRVVVTEQQIGPGSEPTLRDLSEALIAVYGTDFGIHNPTWISRFTDMTRQAAAYRAGRVLLAGDAAHVHYPAGGQGLSLGVQDAVNLGWKLAQVVDGTSPESLLDTYHAERHPVAARALRYTMAQTALQRQRRAHEGRWSRWCRSWRAWTSLASGSPGSTPGWTSTTTSARDTRCSDAACPISTSITADGPLRVFELLHDARPVLLNLGEPGGFDITPWADRVQLIDASYDGRVGAPGARRGQRSHRRADPPRRLRRLGRRRNPRRAPRRADHLVRTAHCGVAQTWRDSWGIGPRRQRPQVAGSSACHRSAAVLVLAVDGAESLDVLGPVEVFDYAGREVPGAYRIDVVGPGADGWITMSNGLRLGVEPLPEPPPRHDTLVVAGGAGARRAIGDPAIVDWIARASRRARRTTSICTGSYLLAAAGLLDGRRATTHWEYCDGPGRALPRGPARPGPGVRPRRRHLDVGRRHRRHGPRARAGRGRSRRRRSRSPSRSCWSCSSSAPAASRSSAARCRSSRRRGRRCASCRRGSPAISTRTSRSRRSPTART